MERIGNTVHTKNIVRSPNLKHVYTSRLMPTVLVVLIYSRPNFDLFLQSLK
jgi:hypothetical protein